MSFFDREQLAQQLAATYEGGRQVDPWERVEDYRRYLDYTAENPESGSSAAASALELPRGRVRAWMNGSKPDPVRAIEVAEMNGWLDLTWSTEVAAGLNVLVAWVLSGGSIGHDNYVPRIAVTADTRQCADRAFRAAGIEEIVVNRIDEDSRATELKPVQNASVLGRFLSVLGAPVGEKNERQPITLPAYLEHAPWEVRRDFGRVYILNRGTIRTDLAGEPVQIREERSPNYRAEVFELLDGLVPEAVQTRSATFRLSKPAAELLYQSPELCEKSN